MVIEILRGEIVLPSQCSLKQKYFSGLSVKVPFHTNAGRLEKWDQAILYLHRNSECKLPPKERRGKEASIRQFFSNVYHCQIPARSKAANNFAGIFETHALIYFRLKLYVCIKMKLIIFQHLLKTLTGFALFIFMSISIFNI